MINPHAISWVLLKCSISRILDPKGENERIMN